MCSFRVRTCVLLVGLAAVLAGCSTTPTSPYLTGNDRGRNPDLAERLNSQAAAIIESNPDRAEKLLREALAADLYHGPAHNNLGTLLLAQGDLYDASEEFQWAAKLLPGHPDPRMNLALTLEIAGRTDEALSTYRTALELYPEHIGSIQALTRLQIRTGALDDGTPTNLATIALRGETEQWRQWARLELARRDVGATHNPRE